jgi:UDP-N-acetylglucosamine--N-acetylmuramyl-(pentapeptide) pyrophosphoryl-undecaprenol N-acetylglucosamine transferase
MSRFIISCGGTGGHLSPGIALAEGLTERGHEVTLLISKKRVDARLIEKYPQFTFQAVPGSGFSWHPVKLIQCMVSQFKGLLFSLRLVRQQKPDGIVAFGGFTSAGIAMAGWLGRVPVALHESNRVPGLAVRVLGGLARRVYLSPGVKLTSVRARHIRFVGMPVRQEIQPLSQTVARETLGLDPNRAVLVVFGGSQGSGPLNEWVREHLKSLGNEGIQVYCVTGLGKGESETITIPVLTGGELKSVFVPFCDQMAALFSSADLVLARAGAGTIAELIRCATPAILVPLPTAADDHQRANATFFEKQGGGLMLEQSKLGQMRAEVLDTIFNDWLLGRFHSNLERMDRANPLDILLDDLEDICRPPDSKLAGDTPAVAS